MKFQQFNAHKISTVVEAIKNERFATMYLDLVRDLAKIRFVLISRAVAGQVGPPVAGEKQPMRSIGDVRGILPESSSGPPAGPPGCNRRKRPFNPPELGRSFIGVSKIRRFVLPASDRESTRLEPFTIDVQDQSAG